MGPIISPEMSDKMPLQVQKHDELSLMTNVSQGFVRAFDVEDEGTFPPANCPGLLHDKGERHSFSHWLPEK